MSDLKKRLENYRGGISAVDIGPPGTGKSTFCGSIAEIYDAKEILLLAPKPREINSWLYREKGITAHAEVFSDPKWRPSLDMYEADGFLKLERRLLELYDDERFEVIILDPYTDVVKLAAHDILKSEKAATPRDYYDSRSFYGDLKYKLENFTKTLVGLTSPAIACPKHVLVACHAQPAKEGEKQESGVSFEGDVMPMIEGGHRHDFASEFDVCVYSKIKHESKIVNSKMVKSSSYVIQVQADNKRHAKIALAPALTQSELPNSVVDLFDKIV